MRNMLDATNEKSSIRKVTKIRVFFVFLIFCCLLVRLNFTFKDTNYVKQVITYLILDGNGSAPQEAMSYIDNVKSAVLYNKELTSGPPGISASPAGLGAVTIRQPVTSGRPATIERPTTTGQQTTISLSVTNWHPTTNGRPAPNGRPTTFEQNTEPAASNTTSSPQQDNNKTILWFNKPSWMKESKIERTFRKCKYRNCHTSTDITRMDAAAAVIFTLPWGLGTQPPVTLDKRNPDQAWVFFTLEAPSFYSGLRQPYFAPGWTSTMNWSMTYMRDADIFCQTFF